VQEFTEQNWSGHHRFTRTRVHLPTTVTEVQRLVAGAERAKVIGARHCLDDIADTAGDGPNPRPAGASSSATPQRIRAVYPRLADFVTLMSELDPDGTFRNPTSSATSSPERPRTGASAPSEGPLSPNATVVAPKGQDAPVKRAPLLW
jgi:hypothetical protein